MTENTTQNASRAVGENSPSPVELPRGISDLLYRPVVFQRPGRLASPRSWEGHIPFAFWLMDAVKPRRLVELGTASGNSYCAFCQAAEFLKLTVDCFAISTWVDDELSEGALSQRALAQGALAQGALAERVPSAATGNDLLQSLAEYHNPRYSAFSQLVRASSDEALEHFADKSIDLLHIDGGDTYEAVLNDFASWLPKLSDSGVMVFHDIAVREQNFGAWRVWEEIIAPRYPCFAFAHSQGLGIAAIGREPTPMVRWLCDQTQNRSNRERFAIFLHSSGIISPKSSRTLSEKFTRFADSSRLSRPNSRMSGTRPTRFAKVFMRSTKKANSSGNASWSTTTIVKYFAFEWKKRARRSHEPKRRWQRPKKHLEGPRPTVDDWPPME